LIRQIVRDLDRAGADGNQCCPIKRRSSFKVCQDMPQIQIHEGRIKQQAVEQVENTANARKKFPESFTPVSRLNKDSIKSPQPR